MTFQTETSVCFRCGKTPEELAEYIDGAENDPSTPDAHETPTEWMKNNDGTYNPSTRHFCCTECYIAIGMPSSPRGWKAP